MVHSSLFSSKTDEWATPQTLFDDLNSEFNFTLDVCATSENAKCSKFLTMQDNGLNALWAPERCWMNPPYSCIKEWMRKADEEAKSGALVVCLVPARTDTVWFHTYAKHYEIRFIKGRLKFGEAKNTAPFPSILVVMR